MELKILIEISHSLNFNKANLCMFLSSWSFLGAHYFHQAVYGFGKSDTPCVLEGFANQSQSVDACFARQVLFPLWPS